MTGADSSKEGGKIWFSWYYKCQKSPKKSFSPSDGGLAVGYNEQGVNLDCAFLLENYSRMIGCTV